MIADDPTSPTSTGFDPLISAGNMKETRMIAAKPRPIREARPRHRATAITTATKISVITMSGVRRSKSENW